MRKGVELSPIENNARRSRRNGEGGEGGRERGDRRGTDRIDGDAGGERDRGARGWSRWGCTRGCILWGSAEQCPAAFDYNVGRNNRIAHGPLKRLHRLTDDRPR